MQEVAHKIHIKKNGAQYDVNLYDNKFPSPDTFFPVKVGGTTYYLPATAYLSGDAAGGSTPLRIKKSGTTYQIIKKAECNINIPTYDKQQIVVDVTNSITGNKATYTNNVIVPFGSYFSAKVQSTNSQYNAGSMTSVSSGTITEKNINLTASPATIAIPTGSLYISGDTTFTVPAGITVIKVGDYSRAKYVRVLPNSTHYLNWSYSATESGGDYSLYCDTHDSKNWLGLAWDNVKVTLYWSPEINNHSTNFNCY
jgi:hypothetical protein